MINILPKNNLPSYLELHFDSVCAHLRMKRHLKPAEQWCRNRGFSLKDLIVGDVETLFEIIFATDARSKEYAFFESLASCYAYFSDSKNKFSNGYSAYDLVEASGLKCCPFCNRSFISIYKKAKLKLRTCWVDHF